MNMPRHFDVVFVVHVLKLNLSDQFTLLFFFKQLHKVIDEFKSVCKRIKEHGASQSQGEMGTNPFLEMNRLTTVLYKETGLSKVW